MKMLHNNNNNIISIINLTGDEMFQRPEIIYYTRVLSLENTRTVD